MRSLILLVAQGFGTGRILVAPGTFGTLLGFAWIYVLLLPRSPALYLVGTILGVLAAVWFGGRAEKILKQKDPGSIVIDEIAALPIAAAPVVFSDPGQLPNFYFINYWLALVLAFAFFRLFDVWKPLVIRKSQSLPGGWGLAVDDVLAAIAAGIMVAIYTVVTR